MYLDDRLDALLGASGQPASHLADDEDARTLAPLLTAARRLTPLREAQPSARFADELERQILASAAGRTPYASTQAHVSPVADGDAPTVPTVSTVPIVVPYGGPSGGRVAPTTTAPHWPGSSRTMSARAAGRKQRRSMMLPVWARGLAVACVLLALGSGLFAAAANAQPGSPLFGLHRAEQWVQVSLASPADKARLHVRYAGDALAALDRAVAGSRGDPTYSSALATLQSELSAAASSIATLPAGQTRDALAAQLAAVEQHARDDLRAALPGLNWDDRVATTAALGGLGESVPHVMSATIDEIAGHDAQAATRGGHTVQIIVSGSGFVAGARLVINGQPAGTVLSVADGTLVAQVSLDPSLAGHVVSIGVENPDGTAARTSAIDHGAAVTQTPAPSVTPTHHGGHGGHG